jgi:hypothetical protein
MIFITAKFRVRPEHADRWPEIAGGFARATRAEPGPARSAAAPGRPPPRSPTPPTNRGARSRAHARRPGKRPHRPMTNVMVRSCGPPYRR